MPLSSKAHLNIMPSATLPGDLRSGSLKRVAAGAGEDSVVIQAAHQFLNPGVA